MYLGRQNVICVGAAATKLLPNLQLQSKCTYNSPCARRLMCLRLTHQHQKQKSTSGWDFSAATPTLGEPFARCACRWAPGGSSGLSAGLWCGRELAGSCWWTEATEEEEKGGKSNHKLFKTHIRHKNTDKNAESAGMLSLKTWRMKSATLNVPLGCLFIFLKVDQRSYEREADVASNCWVCVQAAAVRVCGWLSALMCLHLCSLRVWMSV